MHYSINVISASANKVRAIQKAFESFCIMSSVQTMRLVMTVEPVLQTPVHHTRAEVG